MQASDERGNSLARRLPWTRELPWRQPIPPSEKWECQRPAGKSQQSVSGPGAAWAACAEQRPGRAWSWSTSVGRCGLVRPSATGQAMARTAPHRPGLVRNGRLFTRLRLTHLSAVTQATAAARHNRRKAMASCGVSGEEDVTKNQRRQNEPQSGVRCGQDVAAQQSQGGALRARLRTTG